MANTPAETEAIALKPASRNLPRKEMMTEYLVAVIRIWERLKTGPATCRELEAQLNYSYTKVYQTIRRLERRQPSLVIRKSRRNPITKRMEYFFSANEKAL